MLTDSLPVVSRSIARAVAILVAMAWLGHAIAATVPGGLESVIVAPVWSGHPVAFAIETIGERQYVAYYDRDRRMTVAARRLDSAEWTFQKLPQTLGWDSHNLIALAVDRDGFVHVSGNMHGDPLVYYRTQAPHDIGSLQEARMVGSREKRVSYPLFVHGPDGALFFQYRDGKSGNGVQIVNAYDLETGSWRRLLSEPLLDGGGRMSAYPAGPTIGPDGYFHLAWMWRDDPSGATNHDLSYARSPDLVRWETAGGEPLRLPFRPNDRAAVVDPVPSGGGLAGIAFGVGWDTGSRPILTYSKYGPDGASQAFNARYAGQWEIRQASAWGYRWPLDRTGTLGDDIVVRPPIVDSAGRLIQEFRHLEAGRGRWVLDPESLAPVETLPALETFESLTHPESEIPGMEVREFIRDREGRYFLRWETLPVHRDRPRRPPYPEPSILRVFRLPNPGPAGYPGAERPDSDSPSAQDPPRAATEDSEPETSEPSLDPALLEARGARIGEVSIEVANVFDERDPTENRALFRSINRLRRKTRPHVVRNDLLFGSGDPYSARLLEESERILRSRSYLYEADVRPVAYREAEDKGGTGEVDVEVVTRDVWTLTGGVSFSRSGGENSTRFNARDTNFLGTGKEVGVSRESDVDRIRSELFYRDSNFLGNRGQVELSLQENSDGHRRLLKLQRPFYALDSRRSKGLTVLTERRIDPLFDRGEVIREFRHEIDLLNAHWGFSRGLQKRGAKRWTLGFTYSRDQFAEPLTGPPLEGLPPARTLSYPSIGFEWVEDRFLEARDLDKIARTEDLNLGTVVSVAAGWSSSVFGGDEDQALVGFTVSSGFRPSRERDLLLVDGSGGTRWGRDGFEDANLRGSLRFFRRNLGRHAFLAELQVAAVENLDAEEQLLIGGDSGLRGYPLRFQSGDRRVLLTLEQRFYSNVEVLKLAALGAAIFVDVGRAWFAGGDNGDLGVLKDVGLGLRFVPTRSGRGSVLHLDVALPLDGDGSIESLQFLVTTKESL